MLLRKYPVLPIECKCYCLISQPFAASLTESTSKTSLLVFSNLPVSQKMLQASKQSQNISLLPNSLNTYTSSLSFPSGLDACQE